MKITKRQLRQIIKEELSRTLNEQAYVDDSGNVQVDDSFLDDMTPEELAAMDAAGDAAVAAARLKDADRDEQYRKKKEAEFKEWCEGSKLGDDCNPFLEKSYVAKRIRQGYTRVESMPVGEGPGKIPPGPLQYRISGNGMSAWTNPDDGTPVDTGYYVVMTGGIRGSTTEDVTAFTDSPESPMTVVGDQSFYGDIYAILKK
jgi:hypothetical protein